MPNLVLTRNVCSDDEHVIVTMPDGREIKIRVLPGSGRGTIKLSISAPEDVKIMRSEAISTTR